MDKVLIYTPQVTARVQYTFELLLTDLLSLACELTIDADYFNAYTGPKFSYAKQPLANELFFECSKLLFEEKVRHQPISIAQHDNIQGFFPTPKAPLPFDIFASAFFLVSCYNEYLPHKADKYSRYRASQSMNFKLGFLNKPMVNYYALALQDVLLQRFPQLNIRRHPFKYIATVDVDIAFSYKHKGLKRTIGGFLRSLMFSEFKDVSNRIGVMMGNKKDPYDTFDYMFDVFKKHAIPTQFFFLLGNGSRFDKNTPHCKLPFRQLVKDVAAKSAVGIHLSFKSHISSAVMKMEKERMEEITGTTITANRFHYLRYSLPRSYNTLINLGITDDHSMGYAPYPGFRAGICTPYYFFNLEENAVTELKIHPIAFMDTTFSHYKRSEPAEALESIMEIMNYVAETGGTCVGLWHNSSFTEKGEWRGWRNIFESVATRASVLMKKNGADTATETPRY